MAEGSRARAGTRAPPTAGLLVADFDVVAVPAAARLRRRQNLCRLGVRGNRHRLTVSLPP